MRRIVNHQNKDNRHIKVQSDVLVTKSRYKDNQSLLNTWHSKRAYSFGDEWMYFKLYGMDKRVDEFIGFELSEFMEHIKSKGICESSFYIRYVDTAPHIRLRFKVKPENQNDMMQELNRWFSHLKENGMLTNVQMDTYLREIERYGGENLIELAEDVFYADSIFSIQILKLKRHGNLDQNFDCYICASIIDFLESLGVGYFAQNELFSKLVEPKEHRDIFQKNKENYMKFCNSDNDWAYLRSQPFGEELYELFEKRRGYIETFSSKLTALDMVGKLANSRIGIVLGLIHMHCNRLFGSTSKEREVMSMIRHSLYALAYVKNQDNTSSIEDTK